MTTVSSAEGPRPFYVMGHNPDTLDQVKFALVSGANAIGPDVTVYQHGGELCIGHYGPLGEHTAPDDAIGLKPFLQGLHNLAQAFPNLCLVVFDCKTTTYWPQHGVTLLTAIRDLLTFDLPFLNIIISVGTRDGVALFRDIVGLLRPREGLMMDEDNDPEAVYKYFAEAGVDGACYGNGSSLSEVPVFRPNVRHSIETAVGMHAGRGLFKFVYEWTNDSEDHINEYLAIGVNGIMSDLVFSVSVLLTIVTLPFWASVLRIATPTDNPMVPPNANYELIVHTGDIGGGGTDSMIQFELYGQTGPPSVVRVDANLQGRMERNRVDHVVMPSGDLGPLRQITVIKSGGGLTQRWYLESILINSWRWQVRDVKVVFGQWIDNSGPVTVQIT
jgi:hypothetical protein